MVSVEIMSVSPISPRVLSISSICENLVTALPKPCKSSITGFFFKLPSILVSNFLVSFFTAVCFFQSLSILLSEYMVSERIASALSVCTDKQIIKIFIENRLKREECYEKNLHWDYVIDDLSLTWKELLSNHIIISEGLLPFLSAEDICGNIILQNELVEKLKLQFPELAYFAESESYLYEEKPTDELYECYKKAINTLNNLGYEDILRTINIIFVNAHKGSNTEVTADIKHSLQVMHSR